MAQGVTGRSRSRISWLFGTTRVVGRQPKAPAAFTPGENPWYSLSKAESTSGHMVLSGVPRKKSPVTPPGIDPGTSRLVAQCLNHYATPGPCPPVLLLKNSSLNISVEAEVCPRRSEQSYSCPCHEVGVELHSFLTSPLHAPTAISLEKEHPILIEYEARWVPESIWTFWREENPLPITEIEPRIVLIHLQRLYYWKMGWTKTGRKNLIGNHASLPNATLIPVI